MERLVRKLLAGVIASLVLAGCFQPANEGDPDAGPPPVNSRIPRTCGVQGERILFYPWRPELYDCVTFAGHLNVTVPVGTVDFQEAQGIRAVDGTLAIVDNSSLRSLNGLKNLERVGNLMLATNSELTDLRGLSSLTSAHDVTIVLNPMLGSLEGLGGLRLVHHLEIIDNVALQSLAGLSNLQTITGDLTLRGNDSLSSAQIQAFLGRVTVEGSVFRQ